MKRLPRGLACATALAVSLLAGTALADVAPPNDDGCGCRIAGQGGNLAAMAALFVGAGVLLSRRVPRGNQRG